MKESSTWITDSSGDRINCLTAQQEGRTEQQVCKEGAELYEYTQKMV